MGGRLVRRAQHRCDRDAFYAVKQLDWPLTVSSTLPYEHFKVSDLSLKFC